MAIHKTAHLEDGAQVHESAVIGPFAVIGPQVKIGAGTKIGAHCVIEGLTTIGEDCNIFPGVTIGLEPQDLRYKGEPTGVIVGNRVTMREFVTVHRATGEGFTIVGDDCFLMNYCHVAHNCHLGNGIIMANGTVLGGHVKVGDNTVFSGVCVLHQWTRVGRGVMVGGMTGSRVDLPPFTLCDGRPAQVRGLNVVGLRRQRISAEVRAALKQAYKLLYRSGLNFSQAIEEIERDLPSYTEIQEVCDFFKSSKRGMAVAFGATSEARREAAALDESPVEAI